MYFRFLNCLQNVESQQIYFVVHLDYRTLIIVAKTPKLPTRINLIEALTK